MKINGLWAQSQLFLFPRQANPICKAVSTHHWYKGVTCGIMWWSLLSASCCGPTWAWIVWLKPTATSRTSGMCHDVWGYWRASTWANSRWTQQALDQHQLRPCEGLELGCPGWNSDPDGCPCWSPSMSWKNCAGGPWSPPKRREVWGLLDGKCARISSASDELDGDSGETSLRSLEVQSPRPRSGSGEKWKDIHARKGENSDHFLQQKPSSTGRETLSDEVFPIPNFSPAFFGWFWASLPSGPEGAVKVALQKRLGIPVGLSWRRNWKIRSVFLEMSVGICNFFPTLLVISRNEQSENYEVFFNLNGQFSIDVWNYWTVHGHVFLLSFFLDVQEAWGMLRCRISMRNIDYTRSY